MFFIFLMHPNLFLSKRYFFPSKVKKISVFYVVKGSTFENEERGIKHPRAPIYIGFGPWMSVLFVAAIFPRKQVPKSPQKDLESAPFCL